MTDLSSIPADELRALGNQAFGLALRLLGHRDDAADAVQDAMHQLFRRPESYDARRGTLKAWFFTVVRNRCIDLKRKSKSLTASEHFDPVDSKQLSPEQHSAQGEMISNVRLAMEQISDDAREIIWLRDFHGLTYAEIGVVLKIATGDGDVAIAPGKNATSPELLENNKR